MPRSPRACISVPAPISSAMTTGGASAHARILPGQQADHGHVVHLGQDIGRDPVAHAQRVEPGADRAFRGQDQRLRRQERQGNPCPPPAPACRSARPAAPRAAVRSGRERHAHRAARSTAPRPAPVRPAAAAEPGSTPRRAPRAPRPARGRETASGNCAKSVDSAPTRSGRAAPPPVPKAAISFFARAEDPVGMIQRDAPRLGQDQLPPLCAGTEGRPSRSSSCRICGRKRRIATGSAARRHGSGAPRARPRGNSAGGGSSGGPCSG